MTPNAQSISAQHAVPVTAPASLAAAVTALLLGALILFGVGFAHPILAHNAAHDARHAQGFPCH